MKISGSSIDPCGTRPVALARLKQLFAVCCQLCLFFCNRAMYPSTVYDKYVKFRMGSPFLFIKKIFWSQIHLFCNIHITYKNCSISLINKHIIKFYQTFTFFLLNYFFKIVAINSNVHGSLLDAFAKKFMNKQLVTAMKTTKDSRVTSQIYKCQLECKLERGTTHQRSTSTKCDVVCLSEGAQVILCFTL